MSTEKGRNMKANSVVNFAKDYIQEKIINGQWPAMKQLKEEEIALQLKISRSPIREAFKILESQGFILVKPRCGAFVSSISEHDIWEVFTLKEAILGLASRLAIDNYSPEINTKLQNILNAMNNCIKEKPPNIRKYQNLDETFHMVLVEASEHKLLKKILKNLTLQAKRFGFFSLMNENILLSSYDHHHEIFNAIKNKKIALVEQLNGRWHKKIIELHKISFLERSRS